MKKFFLILSVVPLLAFVWYSLSIHPGTVELPTATPEMLGTIELLPDPTPEPTLEPTPEPIPWPLQPARLTDDTLDASFFAPCEQQGTLVTLDYETKDYHYGTTDAAFSKQLNVYLPYAYNEDRPYNVLLLLHITGVDETFWLPGELGYAGQSIRMMDLLDHMIAQGLCEPLIVVAPCGYITDEAAAAHDSVRDYDQFGYEFANEILPLIVENFSTYAEGTERWQLAAAREHFGVAGASFGSYMTRNSVLAPNLDLCANFAMIGGGSLRQDELRGEWQNAGLSPEAYPIHRLLIVEGELDDRAEPERSYHALQEWTELFNADNLRYLLIKTAAHDVREWVNGVYNSAQLFFRDDIPVEAVA